MNPRRAVLCYLIKALRPLRSSQNELIVQYASLEEKKLRRRIVALDNKTNQSDKPR